MLRILRLDSIRKLGGETLDCVKYLLIGGGLASACAAESIRERDADGTVTMIGRETYVPYHRPPLSKGYLVEGDWEPSDFSHHDEEWYGQHNVQFKGGVTATAVDVDSRQVSLSSGDSVQYERLLIATGAEVIRLDVPGAHLDGIHYLRSIPDADALIAAAKGASRVVVVGGGFIGLELEPGVADRRLRRNAHVLEADPYRLGTRLLDQLEVATR